MLVSPRLNRLADERGQSLVLALLVLTVLAIVLGSVIFFTTSNQRNSAYEKAAGVSRSLAEAGVNNGISVLTNAAQTDASTLLNDGSDAFHSPSLLPNQANAYTDTYPGGSVKWWGTFNATEQGSTCLSAHNANLTCVGVWTLYGTSTVANPTGGAAIHRTVTAKMQAYREQDSNTANVWNWIYSPYKSGSSTNCDTSFTNSLTIRVPVWVGGNLCIQNTVSLQRPVYIGGRLSISTAQAAIGAKTGTVDNGGPVSEAYVGAGCQYLNNPFYNPCQVDNGTVKTHVWAQNLYTSPAQIPSTSIFSGVSAPPLCWGPGDCPPDSVDPPSGGWYSVASPGPLHPCILSSGTPPVFDNLVNGETTPAWGPSEGYANGSVPGVFNLTPDSTDYTCRTAGGELSWNHSTRVLTVQGAVFIDGSATAYSSGNNPVTYTGWGNCTTSGSCDGQCNTAGSCQAVLFLSGTFLMSREHLCAVVNSSNTDCDANAWDPNKKILIIATHGSGGQLPAGQGVGVTTNQASFQGGLYAASSIAITSGGWVQGPLVSGTGTVFDGQSGTLSFPTLTISPFAINQPPAFKLCNSSVPCQPYDYTG